MPWMPAETETHIYRIAQEALANAVRHAGARRIAIEAQPQAQIVTVTVRDDGRGLPASGFVAGHGLLGMRERADILGAMLEITNPASGGTVVRLQVPRRRPEP
jgi:two-component system sensor histidine kinase UhpB